MSSLKSSLVFWNRNKVYSAICLFGLATSLTFVILIADYISQQLSTDKFMTKADRIYAIGSEYSIGSAYGVKTYLLDRYPEIESLCSYVVHDNMPVETSESKFSCTVTGTDSTFFDMFDIPMINGDPKDVLNTMDGAVISEKFAKMAFGDKDPIGEKLLIRNFNVIITGVMKDITQSTLKYCDIIFRIEQTKSYTYLINNGGLDSVGGSEVFILAKEGSDLVSKKDDMRDYFKTFFWIYQREHWKEVTLTPMSKLYFSPMATPAPHICNSGSIQFVIILLSVGILILIFAIINYINLSVAQSGFRAKEMATRRLLGSSKLSVMERMIAESVIFTFVAYLLGLILASLFDGFTSNLLECQMNVLSDMSFVYFISSILFIFLIGIIAGLIPASVISGFQPIDVVRGTFRRRTKMVYSKVFITFQNVITIVLIACSITMIAQVRHMTNADLGYNTENILVVSNQVLDVSKSATFRNEVSQLACVNEVGLCRGYPFDTGNNNTMEHKGKSISFQVFYGDSTYFKMIGFKIIQDNHVSGDNGFWLTESAKNAMEMDNDEASFNFYQYKKDIYGFIEDFHYGNINNPTGPSLVGYNDFTTQPPMTFLIKTSGNPFDAKKQIGAIFDKISDGAVYNADYIETNIYNAFEEQRRTSRILLVFTIIGIIISTLGLFAMSTYFIRQKTLEISVRKVFGSTDNEICTKLATSFLLLVGIAFILSVPIIWYEMDKWLSGFLSHIEVSPLIILCAGLFTLLIAFLTVIKESISASRANPADNMR